MIDMIDNKETSLDCIERMGSVLTTLGTQLKDARDEGDSSLVHHACFAGRLDVLAYLQSKGCSLEVTNLEAETPFMWACSNGQQEMISHLLAQGVDANAKNRYHRSGYDLATVEVQAFIGELLRDL